ncbi:MAG TPA: tetratricopeptide repeat protein, partial [Trueperaceae bacterium]|nr:tetratricopeptide repeat protein [Trueperaceae bacterium]
RQPRERLARVAREHLKRGAALLVAPAGYGKTVLLVELVEGTKEPSVWLQLDEGDNDPAAFVAALVEGTRRAFPEAGARLAEAFGATPGGASGRHLAMLVNAFIDAPAGDWTLVLDDLHLVSNPEVLKLIELLVDAPAPGLHVLMASRSMPSLPVARWRARGTLGVISTEDLRFTAEEAGAWLRGYLPKLSEAAVGRLVDRTEGWPVGLQLAMQLLRDGDDDAFAPLLARLQGAHPVVAGYLMQEVFSRQPPHVQQFLLDTAVLPQLDVDTCAALLQGIAATPAQPESHPLGPTEVAALLEGLELGHAFLQRLDEDERWYRYHQLFREFLLSLAHYRDPGRVESLRSRSARAAEQRGEVDAAVGLYLANGELEEAARLLARHGLRYLRAGRGEALHRWLVRLEPVVRTRPELRFLHGLVLHQRGRLAEAVVALLEARRTALATDRTDVACGAVTAMAGIARSQGDYPRAQEWSEEATAIAQRTGVRATTRASAWLERAKTEGHLHGMVDGRQMAERALAELEASGDDPALTTTALGPDDDHDPEAAVHLHAAFACSLGQICWWHGDVDSAVKHLEDALLRLGDADTPQAAEVRLTLATPTLYRFDHAAATAHAERALEAYQRFELHERLPAAYAALGNCLTRAGEYDRAEACLRQAMAAAAEIGGASYDHVMAAGYLAYVLELQGRTAEAIQVAEEALWAHEGSPTVYEVYVCRSVLADTYLSAGRLVDAERIYRQLVDLGEARQYRIPLALVYFGLAYLTLSRGEREDGIALAERSLAMLSPTHAWQLFADQGERARVVVGAVRASHPGDAFLARVESGLARRAGAGPSAGARTEEQATDAVVTIAVLGEMQVSVGGQPLAAGAWVSAKAHDLLAYLVTLRSESVRVDQALQALWPDEPERAKTAFHTALYRLRGALRRGPADDTKFVLVDGRKYRLDVARLALDIDRFDALLAQARQAEPDAALALLAEADALVRGEYLAGLDYPWLEGERRRVAAAHAEALAVLGDLQLRHGQPDKAAVAARRLSAIDPYSERACVLEMRALAARGDLAAVERRYQEFELHLLAELGVRPAADTLRAYRELRPRDRVG